MPVLCPPFIRRAALCFLLCGVLCAAAPPPTQTLDVSASGSLEWHEGERLYIARGAARAVRGDLVVEADALTARRRDPSLSAPPGASGGDIDLLTAEGNVKITDPRQQIFGGRAVYDLDRGVMKMTGEGLKVVTAKDVVTARDSLEYLEKDRVAIARGRAVADHDGHRIEADVLAAHFRDVPGGGQEMTHMTGKGNVVVVTKDGDVSRGARAYYDVKKDVAFLMEDVRITRGQTQLSGQKAEVNFATGQSRLLAGEGPAGRVRALLPMSSDKEKAEGKKP